MPLLQSILSYFVYFGSFLALLLAVQQVIARKRELAYFLNAAPAMAVFQRPG